MGEAKKLFLLITVLKFLPVWLAQIIIKSRILTLHGSYSKFNGKSTQQVVEELTQNKDLQAVLCYNFGDYGTTPSRSAFFIQALLMHHFLHGGSYPKGGASEIAFHTIPVIEAAGGKVFVRAEVTRILTDGSSKVTGVRVKKGSEEVDIHAPTVISDAGLYNTFGRLLPEEASSSSYFYPIIKDVKHASSGFSVFMGLKASNEELGVKAQNFWVFKENALDKIANDYFNLTAEEAMDSEVPLLFLSFPSTKDPTWNDRYPGRSTCAVVTLSNYSWFEKWENEPVKRRGDDYDAIKNTIGQKMVEQVCEMFPQIRDKIDFLDFGSPLSNRYYIAAPRGEIYGLDHTVERFCSEMTPLLRPKTDIEGLFLTGQDVQSCGFMGALWGGVLASQSILKRNVFSDLGALHKQITKKQ